MIGNFKGEFQSEEYEFIHFDSSQKDDFNEYVIKRGGKVKDPTTIDINNLLKIKPDNHTIIFIKEMLGCAKTTKEQHKGVSYERFSKSKNDTHKIQCMLGRNNGYNDWGVSICYTNLDSIDRYRAAKDGNFDPSHPYFSNTTKVVDNDTVSKGTYTVLKPNNHIGIEPIPKKVKVVKEKKEKEKKKKVVRETGTATATRRVPVIVIGFDGTEAIFGKLGAKKREEFVVNDLKNRPNDPKCVRLYNYISNEKVRIGKTSLPDPAEYNIPKSSYDKHINAVVAAANSNTPYSVSGRHTTSNNWSLFIDAKYNRLCIIPLVVDDELY